MPPSTSSNVPRKRSETVEALPELLRKIRTRKAVVGVIGLGYVGLPLVRTITGKGFHVLGFDIDRSKVEKLNRGETYIRTLDSKTVRTIVKQKKFEATDDFRRLKEADAIIICVPTPLAEDGRPDLQYIRATAQSVGRTIRRGQLVSLESTTYPGTTREILLPEVERTGLKCGRDVFLAFSPEREDPGNKKHPMEKIPKVVGGMDDASGEAACALYGSLVPSVIRVGSPEAAESAKLLENIYRCVNIALVNELKMCFDKMGIDVWEVIRAAATKPFGFQAFYPGPGLGGHCIPIDPFYLSWKAKEFQFATRFIDLAGEINVQMPYYVIGRLEAALRERGRALKDAKILILGLSYKKDIDDPRESPSFKVMELLKERGAKLVYHDPFFPKLPVMRHYRHLNVTPVELTPKTLSEPDAVVIVTDHSAIDYAQVVRHAKLVVDTRNATAGVTEGAEKVVRA